MANFNIDLSVSFGTLNFFPSSISASAGDTVTFNYTSNEGGSQNVTINTVGALFTDPSQIILFLGSSVVRTISSSAGGTYTLSDTDPSSFDPLQITVAQSVPNAFTLNDITGAALSTAYTSNEVTVSGVSSAVSASISGGGALFNVNGGSFSSVTRNVNPNDKIRVRMTSSSAHGTSVNTTLNIGGRTGGWSITTTGTVTENILIPSNFSLPISFRAIKDFFGAGAASDSFRNQRSYFRGGALVPNISQNNNIATSGNLSQNSFVNAYQSAYWTETTANRQFSISPTSPSPFEFDWEMNSANPNGNPYIGYGEARRLLEFRWRFVPSNTPSGVTVTGRFGAGGNPTNALAANTWSSWGSFNARGGFLISVSFDSTVNGTVIGNAEVQVRVASNTTQTLPSLSLPYSVNIGTAGLD